MTETVRPDAELDEDGYAAPDTGRGPSSTTAAATGAVTEVDTGSAAAALALDNPAPGSAYRRSADTDVVADEGVPAG